MAAEQSNKETRNREIRARRAAAKRGLRLVKMRPSRRYPVDVGLPYLIVDESNHTVVQPAGLDDVEAWLRSAS